jgi:hypothetical protein
VAFQFNTDGFQPMEKQVHSITPFFLTLLNLPLACRFTPENQLLAACLPGTH